MWTDAQAGVMPSRMGVSVIIGVGAQARDSTAHSDVTGRECCGRGRNSGAARGRTDCAEDRSTGNMDGKINIDDLITHYHCRSARATALSTAAFR